MFAFVPAETRSAGAGVLVSVGWWGGSSKRTAGVWCHTGAGDRDGSEASVPQILNLRALQP